MKLALLVLAIVNVLFFVFVGPALISAPNWLSVTGGLVILVLLIYLDVLAFTKGVKFLDYIKENLK